ncbi:unnamed protein product [Prorocentrum cordatum]|uniref:DNA 5'-3' helicase n=1 Tax=Prorocentrum cordatum TaxID=2364126 RepID=A0ABN9PSX8_9DINO|nr:unnamed protein product [Polarella glacialis]
MRHGHGSAGEAEPSILVFDEAHNIDDVCIEALSVRLNRTRLDQSSGNLTRLSNEVERVKREDASRLQDEYRRLVQGLQQAGQIDAGIAERLQSPQLPEDLVNEAIPGNIRRAEHFLALLRRIVNFLKRYIHVDRAQCEGPLSIIQKLEDDTEVDSKSLKFCHERLRSLLNTLRTANLDELTPIVKVADFVTMLGTYAQGFTVIVDPYPEAEGIYDPMLLLSCLDASLAMRPLLKRYQSIVLTSGTISPLEMYPKILGMTNVVATESFSIQMERKSLCPLIVTHGPDQVPVTSRFSLREDPAVVHNYGVFLEQLVQTIPDGMVCFFTSYRYMEQVIEKWYETGVISRVLQHKLVFIETKDVVATTYALSLYRQACDSGQGAVFLSVARGKVSEGIDFDRHYGRCVVLFGVPFQYTLSRELRARLEFLREHYQIKEAEFLNFDAMRQASQCLGRVIRSKKDYGVMIFADQRYARQDKRSKIPDWIRTFIEPGHFVMATDMAVNAARSFLLQMSQPYVEITGAGASVLTLEALQDLQAREAEAALSARAPCADSGGGPAAAEAPGAKRPRQVTRASAALGREAERKYFRSVASGDGGGQVIVFWLQPGYWDALGSSRATFALLEQSWRPRADWMTSLAKLEKAPPPWPRTDLSDHLMLLFAMRPRTRAKKQARIIPDYIFKHPGFAKQYERLRQAPSFDIYPDAIKWQRTKQLMRHAAATPRDVLMSEPSAASFATPGTSNSVVQLVNDNAFYEQARDTFGKCLASLGPFNKLGSPLWKVMSLQGRLKVAMDATALSVDRVLEPFVLDMCSGTEAPRGLDSSEFAFLPKSDLPNDSVEVLLGPGATKPMTLKSADSKLTTSAVNHRMQSAAQEDCHGSPHGVVKSRRFGENRLRLDAAALYASASPTALEDKPIRIFTASWFRMVAGRSGASLGIRSLWKAPCEDAQALLDEELVADVKSVSWQMVPQWAAFCRGGLLQALGGPGMSPAVRWNTAQTKWWKRTLTLAGEPCGPTEAACLAYHKILNMPSSSFALRELFWLRGGMVQRLAATAYADLDGCNGLFETELYDEMERRSEDNVLVVSLAGGAHGHCTALPCSRAGRLTTLGPATSRVTDSDTRHAAQPRGRRPRAVERADAARGEGTSPEVAPSSSPLVFLGYIGSTCHIYTCEQELSERPWRILQKSVRFLAGAHRRAGATRENMVV